MKASSKTLWLAAAFAALAAVTAPTAARAQGVDIDRPFTGERPFQLDVHAGFTWWGNGFASGVRFGIPLLDNGFVPSINNAVYLNFGADFYFIERYGYRCDDPPDRNCYTDYGPGFGFPVTLHWEFYFNDSWSAFAEIGGQFFLHPRWLDEGRFGWYQPGAWFIWTVGGSYHVNESFLLTLRVGSPYVAFGLTFQF
jgi:hypothetical protein